MVEHLLSKNEALDLIPSATKEKKKGKKRKKKKCYQISLENRFLKP
jgi:hypothetical protein